jgi:1,4-dihydroxy-2-naphthoate octaprenyltransferase
MATPTQWLAGARPRTLPAALAPVLVGTGAAAGLDGFRAGPAVLALVVALALQVAVNYANDYSPPAWRSPSPPPQDWPWPPSRAGG